MNGDGEYPHKFLRNNDAAAHSKTVRNNVRVIRGSLMGLIGEVITTTDNAQTLTVVIDQLGCAKVTLPPKTSNS